MVLESDSLMLVDYISSPGRGIFEFHALVSIIKSMLVLHSNFELKFVRRQASMTAHTLATTAYSCARYHVFEMCPLCIEHILINDIS